MADDPLTTVRERTRTNLFWRHLGIEVDGAREGWVRLRLPVRDELCNASGAPVHGGVDILAEGRILRRGRTIAVGDATITDGTGRLLAVGRATYMILAPRAEPTGAAAPVD